VSGLAQSLIPTLLVQGDNRQGLSHAITQAIGGAEINMSLLMAQVVGGRYSALFGFENEADAAQATALIKKAAAPAAGLEAAIFAPLFLTVFID
jgi:hypothetical protein